MTIDELKAYAATKVTLIEDDPNTWSQQRWACANMSPGSNVNGDGKLNGFVPWAPDSQYRTNIMGASVEPKNMEWMHAMGADQNLGIGFPIPIYISEGWGDCRYGIPTHIVTHSTPRVEVRYDLDQCATIVNNGLNTESYPGYSDPGPFPLVLPPQVQQVQWKTGVNYAIQGDKHVFILDKDGAWLHEFWNLYYLPHDGGIYSGCSATFDLMGGDHQRPWGWPSGSVSGAPQFAGQAWYEEVAQGHIDHALAFTAMYGYGRAACCSPGQNHQWNSNDPNSPPFGARIRLKQSFWIDNLMPPNQVIMKCLKEYGMFYVDGGHPFDLYWSADDRWNWDAACELSHILMSPENFEFVEAGPIYSQHGGPAPPPGPAPVINHCEVYPTTVRPGEPAIVFWDVQDAAMQFLSTVGALRTNYAIVYPKASSPAAMRDKPDECAPPIPAPGASVDYTVTASSFYGRVQQTVTVQVEGSAKRKSALQKSDVHRFRKQYLREMEKHGHPHRPRAQK